MIMRPLIVCESNAICYMARYILQSNCLKNIGGAERMLLKLQIQGFQYHCLHCLDP